MDSRRGLTSRYLPIERWVRQSCRTQGGTSRTRPTEHRRQRITDAPGRGLLCQCRVPKTGQNSAGTPLKLEAPPRTHTSVRAALIMVLRRESRRVPPAEGFLAFLCLGRSGISSTMQKWSLGRQRAGLRSCTSWSKKRATQVVGFLGQDGQPGIVLADRGRDPLPLCTRDSPGWGRAPEWTLKLFSAPTTKEPRSTASERVHEPVGTSELYVVRRGERDEVTTSPSTRWG